MATTIMAGDGQNLCDFALLGTPKGATPASPPPLLLLNVLRSGCTSCLLYYLMRKIQNSLADARASLHFRFAQGVEQAFSGSLRCTRSPKFFCIRDVGCLIQLAKKPRQTP